MRNWHTLFVQLSMVLLMVAAGVNVVAAQNAETNGSPELIVDVDINDEVWLRDHVMTEGDVGELVARLKQNGCQTLLVRCGERGYWVVVRNSTIRSYDPI